MLFIQVVVLAILGRAWAVFRDDAFHVDWKLSTIGVPRVVGEFGNNSIAILTRNNVLAALSADGFTVWRKVLDSEQASAGLAVVDGVGVVGGDSLAGFNLSSGDLLWTVNHAAAAVWTDPATNQAIVDGKHSVSPTGAVRALEAAVASQSPPVFDGHASVKAGELEWDQFGVLQLKESNSDDAPLWVRNEGLASVVDALFVPASEDGDDTHQVVEDYADLFDPAVTGLGAWTARVVRHVGQLKNFAFYALRRGVSLILLPEPNDGLFGFDQLLIVVTKAGSVYALDTQDGGTVAWVYHDLNAVGLQRDPAHADQFKVVSKDAIYSMSYDGIIKGLDSPDEPTAISSVTAEESLEGVRLTSQMYEWSVVLPGTQLVGSASRDPEDVTTAIAVVIEESHVQYKYLNPYAAAYATYDPASRGLTVTLIDTVSGRILDTAIHSDPVVINDEWPFNIVFGEHWIVYTYLSQDQSAAPKITLWELYESPEIDSRVSLPEEDILNDTLQPFAIKRTWVAPSRNEPVYSLALSRSTHGAVTREIILGLQHQVVALPKWAISALAPSPELVVPQQSHLSHVYGVDRAAKIVTSPTKIESTYLVAALGGADVFFTRSSPSGEIDRLGPSFPRLKLIILIAALGFATTTLAPLARRKVLEAQWR